MSEGDRQRTCAAIITARGGSKGVPRKNVRLLGGVPLVVRTIRSAMESGVFGIVAVSSDCPEILELARAEGAFPIQRPDALATDDARSESAIRHALETIDAQTGQMPTDGMLLQPTSPLRNVAHIRDAWAHYEQQQCTSLVSVVAVDHPPQKCLTIEANGNVAPLVSWEALTMSRQELPSTYRPNGAIYVFDSATFLANGFLFTPPLGLMVMTEQSSIDIDSAEDFVEAEIALKLSRQTVQH